MKKVIAAMAMCVACVGSVQAASKDAVCTLIGQLGDNIADLKIAGVKEDLVIYKLTKDSDRDTSRQYESIVRYVWMIAPNNVQETKGNIRYDVYLKCMMGHFD